MMRHEFIPNKGYKLTDGKISIMSLVEARVKKGEQLPQPFSFATACLQLVRDLGSETGPNNPIEIEQNPKMFGIGDFIPYREKFIYKYIPADYLKFYNKGLFRLGTIDDYQKIENAKIRDEFEGYSVLKIRTDEQDLYSVVIGGYNHYVFCSTHNEAIDKLNPQMQNTFGDVLLKIEIEPFAEKIRKRLGASSYAVYEVKYSNGKLFEASLPDIKLQNGVMFNSSLFHPLTGLSFVPCLFIKPFGFQQENEIRITFEMPYDVISPKTFEHTGLLKYVKEIR